MNINVTKCRLLQWNNNNNYYYKRNWIQHVNRMPRNRLPWIMKRYSPTGRKNHGRPLKRLLDTWDRNGSTSGPTPWQIFIFIFSPCMLSLLFFYFYTSTHCTDWYGADTRIKKHTATLLECTAEHLTNGNSTRHIDNTDDDRLTDRNM
jgi:hypothetical protein